MSDPIFYARAVHFATTITVVALLFIVFIGEPGLRKAPSYARLAITLRSQLARIAWISLAPSVLRVGRGSF